MRHSVIVLSKPNMSNSFNHLLITLSTLDSIFIVLALYDYTWVRAFGLSSRAFAYLFPYVIYPFNNISFCASIFVTVALAYERYIAVCSPIYYRNVTSGRKSTRRTLSYVIPCLVLSVLLNVPKFLESKFVWRSVNRTVVDPETNRTEQFTEEILSVGPAALREDPDYIRFYINWTRLVTTGLVPMAALVFFNWNIFRGIRMTHERTRRKNKQKASEMNLAAILVCIVIVFTICHSPRIMLNVHEFFMLDDMLQCGREFMPPVWFLCMTSFNHWLLIANASTNFIIYCSVGAGFKEVFRSFVRKCPPCCLVCLRRMGLDSSNRSSGNDDDDFVTAGNPTQTTGAVAAVNTVSHAANGKSQVVTTTVEVEMTTLPLAPQQQNGNGEDLQQQQQQPQHSDRVSVGSNHSGNKDTKILLSNGEVKECCVGNKKGEPTTEV